MEGKRKLPMGIENFERIRRDRFYYVDKTRMVKDLLENMALVNLFTRPRRFGKTLNMSMLKYFFETGSDNALFDGKTLFEGLEISKEKELCDKHMGKFPVIFISLEFAVLTGCLRISKESNVSASAETSKKAAFDIGCREALKQINARNYEERLIDDGMTTIRKYGIACYKRHCKVISG